MPAFGRALRRLLAQLERRVIQLLGLAALGLGVLLVSAVPFAGRGSGGAQSEAAVPPVALRAPLVLPRPRQVAPDLQAVLDTARGGQPVRSGGGHRRLVALTFDDGPGPYTDRFARVLRDMHVPATFFQVGRMLDVFPASAAATTALPGAVIGDHTYDHAAMGRLSMADQRDQVLRAASAMTAHGEQAPRLFRPPYGSWNAATTGLLQRRGMAMILWSVDAQDYRNAGVDRLVRSVVGAVKPGGIVLLHDGGGDRRQTLRALPRIVRALRHKGYGLVSVPELLRRDPPAPAGQDAG